MQTTAKRYLLCGKKILLLIVSLTVMLLACRPATAQESRQLPRPGVNPGAAAVSGGNLIKLPTQKTTLKAGLVVTHSRAAIPFKPFPMVDPRTNKPIAPTAIIALPNGKHPTAKEYYTELNQYEEWLSAHGYSLHTTPKGARIALQEIAVDRGMLQRQIQQAPRPTSLPRRQDLLMHSLTRQAMARPQAIQINPTHLTMAKIPMSPDLQMNAVNEQLRASGVMGVMSGGLVISSDSFSWLAAIKVNTQTGQAPFQRRATTSVNTQTKAAQTRTPHDPRLLLKAAGVTTDSCSPVNKTQGWNWNAGDPSTFAGYVNGSISLTGELCKPPDLSHFEKNKSHFKVQADGKAGGSVFGIGGDLLRVTGSLAGDQGNNTVSANFGIYSLGIQIYNQNKSATYHWETGDRISKDVDFSTTIPIPVGPFDLDVTIGAKGSVGFEYGVSLYPTNVAVSGGPFVHSNVYAQAGVRFIAVEAGAGVSLSLVNWDMNLHGQAGIGWLFGFYLQEELYADSKLSILDGNVYVYAKVYYPCLDPWPDICNSQWDHSLWSWSGIHFDNVIFEIKDITPLDWKLP